MTGRIFRVHDELAKIIDDEWKKNNREISKLVISKRIAEAYKKFNQPIARISNYPFKSKVRIIKE